MIKKIKDWLANPKRNYHEGLDFFNQFASKGQKETFGEFLNDVQEDEDVSQFDEKGRFPILVNQIVFVEKRLQSNKEEFAKATQNAPEKKKAIIKAINTDKVIQFDALPDELAAERDRLKEIVPVMAKLHGDMADEKLADDKRAAIRAELVKHDDERRAIWDKIDSYTEVAKLTVEKSAEETSVEKNMMAMGAKTALRIGQLKGYIARNEEALKKHTEAGNQKKADNAKEKIEAYKAELTELEALFPKNE